MSVTDTPRVLRLVALLALGGCAPVQQPAPPPTPTLDIACARTCLQNAITKAGGGDALAQAMNQCAGTASGTPARAQCVAPYVGPILQAHPEIEPMCRSICTPAAPARTHMNDTSETISRAFSGALTGAGRGLQGAAAASPPLPSAPAAPRTCYTNCITPMNCTTTCY